MDFSNIAAGSTAIDPHTGQPVAFRPVGQNISAPEQLRELLGEGLWKKFTRGKTEAPTVNAGMSRSSVEDGTSGQRADWLNSLDWGLLKDYGVGEARKDYNQVRVLRRPDGTYAIGSPYENKESWKSGDWQKAAGMAAAIFGGGALVGGALGGAGSGITLGGAGGGAGAEAVSGMDLAADAALGTGNNITTAGGLLSAAPAAAPAAAAAPNMAATNPALIESAVGTPGYGLSSAGAGGGAGALAGSLPSWLPKELSGVWDFVKDNPKLVGALAGGLLGGASSDASTSEPAPYNGPMPTIKRGNWSATPTGYDPSKLAPGGGGLLNVGGQRQPASGLGRYMGLLGR
jgi:hypothetical protein